MLIGIMALAAALLLAQAFTQGRVTLGLLVPIVLGGVALAIHFGRRS